MNDQLTVKKILTNTISTDELDTTSRSFARVVSSRTGEYLRRSTHIGSMSPTDLRVSHQARTAGNNIQRSLIAVDQTLTRLDTSSNPIGKTRFKVALQTDIPDDVSQAEWLEAFALLIGALLETDAAIAKSIFAGEA